MLMLIQNNSTNANANNSRVKYHFMLVVSHNDFFDLQDRANVRTWTSLSLLFIELLLLVLLRLLCRIIRHRFRLPILHCKINFFVCWGGGSPCISKSDHYLHAVVNLCIMVVCQKYKHKHIFCIQNTPFAFTMCSCLDVSFLSLQLRWFFFFLKIGDREIIPSAALFILINFRWLDLAGDSSSAQELWRQIIKMPAYLLEKRTPIMGKNQPFLPATCNINAETQCLLYNVRKGMQFSFFAIAIMAELSSITKTK